MNSSRRPDPKGYNRSVKSSRTRDIRFSVRIKARPEQVYRALTSARELCRWWLEGAETDARNGGRFRMVWPRLKAEGVVFPAALSESEGIFVDLEPARKVAWIRARPRLRGGPPLVSFFILPQGRGAEVTLIQAGFPANRGQAAYDGCARGWADALAKLKRFLETGRAAKTEVLSLS